MADSSKIIFTSEDGEKVEFTVIDKAKLGGVDYLLVSDDETDEAYIFTEVLDEKNESVYEILEDEKQLKIIMGYFNDILEDIDLEF